MQRISKEPTLSIVIPTYLREQILLDTIGYHLKQTFSLPQFDELIVIDQSPRHEPEVARQLERWNEERKIRWIRCEQPHLTRSMNRGLLEARSKIVLYTDDDVIPAEGWLAAHLAAHLKRPEAWAIVGQILQPGEEAEEVPYQPKGGALRRYMDFPFGCTRGQFIENAMAGNLSVKRDKALEIGGFDENFPPPVASRFESEFAKRLISSGGKVWFEPRASLRHLAATTGGTRSKGGHLTSISPNHGIGDCYFALRSGRGFEKWWYLIRKPFREIRTKFHLRHPWWIPVKFIGELRALYQVSVLVRRPPALITNRNENPVSRPSGS